MSNPSPPDDSKEDALAALHGLRNSQHPADPEEHEDLDEAEESQARQVQAREDGAANSAASGFVGMLAQEQTAGAAPQTSATPLRAHRDHIQMAREIQPPPRPQIPMGLGDNLRPAARKPPKTVPPWYHAAVPVLYTLASILILIGLWAAGALIYMALKTPADPADVAYPWIAWHVDPDTELGTYTSGSKIMAIAMLVCLPVSLALALMASLMQKQIRAADRAPAK